MDGLLRLSSEGLKLLVVWGSKEQGDFNDKVEATWKPDL